MGPFFNTAPSRPASATVRRRPHASPHQQQGSDATAVHRRRLGLVRGGGAPRCGGVQDRLRLRQRADERAARDRRLRPQRLRLRLRSAARAHAQHGRARGERAEVHALLPRGDAHRAGAPDDHDRQARLPVPRLGARTRPRARSRGRADRGPQPALHRAPGTRRLLDRLGERQPVPRLHALVPPLPAVLRRLRLGRGPQRLPRRPQVGERRGARALAAGRAARGRPLRGGHAQVPGQHGQGQRRLRSRTPPACSARG